MRLSHLEETAIAATMCLVNQDKPITSKSIAKKIGKSYQLVCKVLQRMHWKGLVHSMMGPKGGYKLLDNDITMLEVCLAFEGVVYPGTTPFDHLNKKYAEIYLAIVDKMERCKLSELKGDSNEVSTTE